MRECPFCGFDEGWVHETSYKLPTKFKVVCKVCGGSGPEANSRDMSERKWDGLLASIEIDEKFEEILKEEMGGVSAPAATLANVPGVGNAQPASFAAMTGAQQYDQGAIGSGDKWGGVHSTKKEKKKKVLKRHKISSYEDYAKKVKINGLTKR